MSENNGQHPADIRAVFDRDLSILTLADVRKLVEDTKDWDEHTPVHVSVPNYSYISDRGPDKGKEICDNYCSMQATSIIEEEPCDEDDERWISVIMCNPAFLRMLFEDYEPEDFNK